MKNAKRILALMLAVLMLLVLSACLGTDEPETTNEETTVIYSETKQITDAEETTVVLPETETETIVAETESAITEKAEVTEVPETTPQAEKLKIYSIGEFQFGLAVIYTSTGYGYINTRGKIVVEPIYEEAYPCSGEYNKYVRALVKKNGKYGYLDDNGNIAIEIKYDQATPEFVGLALVSLDGTSYYINKSGEVAYTVTGSEVAIGEYSNGYIWVQTKKELISGTKYYLSYYDLEGECITQIENGKPCVYKGVDYSSVSLSKMFLYYDNNGLNRGEISIEGFTNEVYFTHGQLLLDDDGVRRDISHFEPLYHNYFVDSNNYYYLDMQNIYDVEFKKASNYSGGMLTNVLWIYLDDNCYYRYRYNSLWATSYEHVIIYKDEVIIELEKIGAFSNAQIQGVACVPYGGDNYFAVHLKSSSNIDFYSLINDKGEVIIQPTNEYSFMYSYTELDGFVTKNIYSAYSFKTGYCKAQDTKTGLWGFIDMNGQWIIKPKYNKVSDFYNSGSYVNPNLVAVVDDNSIISINGNRVYKIPD